LKGRNVPKKNMKDATHMIAKAGSFKGRMNSMTSTGLGLGVNRDLTVKFAMTSIPRITKEATLIVQGNPIRGMSFETMIGKITPPREEPDAWIPKAAARFLKNHVPTELIAA
jgi:hypothetical protein